MKLRALFFFAIVIVASALGSLAAEEDLGPPKKADTYIAPQYDLFVTHNSMFRSHFIVAGNWLTSESKFSSAWAQYDIDIGLFAYFRRYIFKDPDPEKSKRVSFRLGYLQVSDLKSDPNGFDEKRPLAEIVLRFPAGQSWLFDDRNRGEYRDVNGAESARYRNRLRIEHNVAFKDLRLTPYASGEIFYDGKTDRWSEMQGAMGLDIPWGSSMIVELECMGQYVEGELNTVSFGFNLQKYL